LCLSSLTVFRHFNDFFAKFHKIGVYTVLLAHLLMLVLLLAALFFLASLLLRVSLLLFVSVMSLLFQLLFELRAPAAVAGAGVPAEYCCLLYCAVKDFPTV
jgi:hypothetical protein